MYQVLVPVDRDETRALHQAKYVTRLPDAASDVEATVCYVVPPDEFADADEVTFEDVDAAVDAAAHLDAAGVSVTRRVDDGSPSAEIVRLVDELDADEVVMGGRKRSGVARVLLGSTVQDVTLSTRQPVTVTGRDSRLGDGVRRVLVPVDRDETRALHQARYVANLPGDPETIEATVCYVFAHQDYRGAPHHEFEEVDAAVAAADYLADEGVSVDRVVTGGEVARTIIDAAEERDVDGIVMGGRKRSGVQKVLLGSTVQDVMVSAERPVTITG
ncbi:MAG: universal stress protein [Haloplanus sp.]